MQTLWAPSQNAMNLHGVAREVADLLERNPEVMNAAVSISQAEVRALIRITAKAKGRYLAALIDQTSRSQKPAQATSDLRRLREHHEELSHGVERVKSLILKGEVLVQGIGL